jgi:error-prone DNA polymerase
VGAPRAQARRIALWQLGVATPGARQPEGTQLALPLDVPAAPPLAELAPWESMVADYATTGLTLAEHPVALLRPGLPRGAVSSRDLLKLRHETRIGMAGLVVARQRPGTAKGIVFLLVEDEHGTVNLVIPPPVYEAHRLVVRSEPLIYVEGRLEKLAIAGGQINVYVHRVRALDAPDEGMADVVELAARSAAVAAAEGPGRAAAPAVAALAAGGMAGGAAAVAGGHAAVAVAAAGGAAAAGIADFRGVAPPVMSFASGRRR